MNEMQKMFSYTFNRAFSGKIKINGKWVGVDIDSMRITPLDIAQVVSEHLEGLEKALTVDMFRFRSDIDGVLEDFYRMNIYICPTNIVMYLTMDMKYVLYEGKVYEIESIGKQDVKVFLEYRRFSVETGESVLELFKMYDMKGNCIREHYHVVDNINGKICSPLIHINLYEKSAAEVLYQKVSNMLGTINLDSVANRNPQGLPSADELKEVVREIQQNRKGDEVWKM